MRKTLLIMLCLFCIYSVQAQITTIKTFDNTFFEGVRLLNNGNIIFSAKATGQREQVWMTDGTAAGTKALTSFCNTSLSGAFKPFLNTYYEGVSADASHYYGIVTDYCTSPATRKVFKTDGNTITYSTYTPGTYANPQWYGLEDSGSVGSKMYMFYLAKEIYEYDKNSQNIQLVYGPGNPYPAANNDISLISKKGTDLLLFFHNSGDNNGLLKFNTTNHTVTELFNFGQFYLNKTQHTQINPRFLPPNSHLSGYQPNVINWNGFTYFFISYSDKDYKNHIALWKSDGTTAGTMEVKDIITPSSLDLTYGVSFTPFNGNLYFRFSDKTRSGIWSTDGSTAGTQNIVAVNADTLYHSFYNLTSNMVELNGKLYFLATDRSSNDMELWESDGTIAGTVKSFDFAPAFMGLMDGTTVFNIIYKYNNRIYFKGELITGNKQIITTDGTINGTYSLGGKYNNYSKSPIIFNNDNLYYVDYESSSKSHLQKISLTNAKPLLLNHNTTAAKGQTFTVTGYDLRNANNVYFFDHNNTNYTSTQNVQQINDTTISFIIPSNFTLSNFKIAVGTSQGTFISKSHISAGTTAVDEYEANASYLLINRADKFIISFGDVSKENTIRLIDISGRILIDTKATGQFEISKKDYTAGVYIISVNNKSQKVIIQ